MSEDLSFRFIPVGGKHTEIYGDKAKVSPGDYEYAVRLSWAWHQEGYVMHCGKCITRMILDPGVYEIVDHKNGDRSDNRRSNLRMTDSQGNAENRRKKVGATSKYLGVCYDKKSGKFVVQISGAYLGCYENEIEAAVVHDRWVVQRKTLHKLNFPEREEEFRLMPLLEERKRTNNSGFKGVYFDGKMYEVKVRNKRVGRFKTAEEAASAYDMYIVENDFFETRLNFPERYPEFVRCRKARTEVHEIDWTEQGFEDIDPETDCKFFVMDKTVLIEKSDYEEHVKHENFYLGDKNYPAIKGKGRLHRLILGETDPNKLVDHMKSNPYDARRRMLRVTDHSGNAKNCKKREGCSSDYKGVSKKAKTWKVAVEGQFIEYRKSEEEAARLRDLYIYRHYPDPEQWFMNFKWTEQEKIEWTAKLASKKLE